MLKQTFGRMVSVLALMALLLSACGAVEIKDQAAATAEFETAVAAAVTAKVTPNTPTSEATQTFIPSETPSPTITVTPSLTPVPPTSITQNFCDNSAFLQDVTVPDGTLLAPGQVFEKTWTFKNTGICTWKPGYTIAFVRGDLMLGNTRALNLSVAPEELINVSVKLIAPYTPGQYSGAWRLVNSQGKSFGDYVGVVIEVAGPGTAVPSLAAETPTLTPTLAP